jgi:ferredoxin
LSEPVPSKPDQAPVQVDASVTVKRNGQDYVFDCAASDTLLDAALDAGVPAPCSCCEGHCGTCLAKLVEGAVALSDDAIALSRRDRERGFILACQAYPAATAIIIDYDF